MSLYIVIYVLLLVIGLFSAILNKNFRILYRFTFILLTLMLCLRYGQGVNYFSYETIYNLAPVDFRFDYIYYSNTVHAEIGWKIINHFAKLAGIEFKILIIIISLIEMLFLNRFVKLYCRSKNIALLLIYPTLYLTYCFSAIRQGLVICVFLGFVLELILKKEYSIFIIAILLLSSIHSVALIILICPFILKINMKVLYKVLPIAFIIGVMFSIGLFRPILTYISKIGSLDYYISSISINYFALFERIIMTLLILYMFAIFKDKAEDNVIEEITKMYIFGTIIYLVFFWNSTLASRIGYIFKVLEIALISTMIIKMPKFKSVLLLIVFVLLTFMFTKNIESYIDQGLYYNEINVINYPYISLFNEEDIIRYSNIKSVFFIE